MRDPTGQLRLLVTGPALCALMLAAIMVDNRRYRSDADYAAYHRRAAVAVKGIPLTIGDWAGRDQTLSDDELKLLDPNAYRCIAFSDTRADALGDPSRRVLMLVDQCKWADNMQGHYPPICYKSRGYDLIDAPPGQLGRRRTWTAGAMKVRGMEYFFEHRGDAGRVNRTAIYNFMVIPQQGVRPDMESVAASAEDYQQRYYGAAQFQLVFGGALAQATPAARKARDTVFAELIGPCSGVVTTLCDGVYEHE